MLSTAFRSRRLPRFLILLALGTLFPMLTALAAQGVAALPPETAALGQSVDSGTAIRIQLPLPAHLSGNRIEDTLQAAYIGGSGALVVFNLMLFATLRDRSYLHYGLFATTSVPKVLAWCGIALQFPGLGADSLSTIAAMLAIPFNGIALLLFTRGLLATRITAPALDRLMRLFIGFNAVLAFGCLWAPAAMQPVGMMLDMCNLLLALTVGITGTLSGQRSGGIFLAAMSCLLAAAVLGGLRASGLAGLPADIVIYGIHAGAAVALLLLALALANRFIQLKREREIVQLELVASLRRAERELEHRVAERTEALMRSNEALRIQERALQAAKEVAEQASRMKSTFLASMSHEIRTPMNAVIGMAWLALQTGLTGKQRDYVENIHRAGINLLRLIDDILDFSRIEAGKMVLEKAPFSLDELLSHVRTVTAQQAADKRLRYQFDIAPEVPARLIGDSLRLGQVLINLLNNAIKFTEQGHVTLRCRVAAREQSHVRLHFEVEDSGIGMTQTQQERLFKAFSQADDSITRRYGGSGLGLAISKRLVELMGARITLESAPGQGSTFRFMLGFETGADAPTRPPAALPAGGEQGQVGPTPRIPRLAERRILLVEDNEVNRRIALDMLAATGARTEAVANGRLALECLFGAGPGAFDLVLMDLRMPELGGLAATRRIRMDTRFAHLPIIAMTAHATDEERRACLEAGMQGHLAKPIEPTLFYRTLAAWLNKDGTHVAPRAPAPLLRIAGVDTSDGLARLSGDAALYRRVLELLIPNLAASIAEVRQARAAQDAHGLRTAIHGIRGMAANVGALELAATAGRLEHMLREQKAADALLDSFLEQCEAVLTNVRRALATGATEIA